MCGLLCGELNNIGLWFVSAFQNLCCICRYMGLVYPKMGQTANNCHFDQENHDKLYIYI